MNQNSCIQPLLVYFQIQELYFNFIIRKNIIVIFYFNLKIKLKLRRKVMISLLKKSILLFKNNK